MDPVVSPLFEIKPLSKEDFCYLILIQLALTDRETMALNEQLSWLCKRKRVITEESKRIYTMGHQILSSGAGEGIGNRGKSYGPLSQKQNKKMSYLI